MNDKLFPLKVAISRFMRDFYEGLYPDTPALESFVARGIERSVVWAPGRMAESAEDMLRAYQKNQNSNTPNAGALLPIIVIAMSKDYMPTGGADGGRQVERQLVAFDDAPDASVYGYRQAAGDVRVQIMIAAAEVSTARSIAAQFGLWVASVGNRRLQTVHTFGQYTINLGCMIETPDIVVQNIATEQKNLTMLATDITIRALIPYFDAPREGEPNDGSTHNPPGYPLITGIHINGRPAVASQAAADPALPPLVILQECEGDASTEILTDLNLTIDEW